MKLRGILIKKIRAEPFKVIGMERMAFKVKYMKNMNMPESQSHHPMARLNLNISWKTLRKIPENRMGKKTVQCGLSGPCFQEKRMTTTP